MYNLTNISNVNNSVEFLNNVNVHLMQGWYGVGILFTITIIAFLAFIKATGEASKALAASMFISFVMALFLRILGLVPDLAIYLTLILLAVSVVLVDKG